MAIVLKYHMSARQNPYTYLGFVLPALGIGFLVFATAQSAFAGGGPTPALLVPALLVALAVVGSVPFIRGTVRALRENAEWGSWVDTQSAQLVWWDGDAWDRHSIDLRQVSRILNHPVEPEGPPRLKLLNKDGKPIHFPEECAPPDWNMWTRSLLSHFPHIRPPLTDWELIREQISPKGHGLSAAGRRVEETAHNPRPWTKS